MLYDPMSSFYEPKRSSRFLKSEAQMIGRIFLFVITNIIVITTVTVISSLLGLDSYISATGLNYGSLAVFCLLWGFVGSFFSLAISRWVAKKLLKIQVISLDSAGELTWLVSLVHDTAKKAQLPSAPEVGIYQSDEPNAFATGPTKSRSLVAFSTGLLNALDRNAVEGVVAHEIAHIQNGDMVTMTILQGIINAFVMFFARVVAWAASQAVDEKLSWIVWYVVLILFQIIFGMLGMLVTSWFSRKREYIADAGSARLAGTDKMTAALKSLQDLAEREYQDAMPTSMAAFGISGKSSGLLALWATHPPLKDRIGRLQKA
jgi:heat shock protein HtpX